MTAKEARALAAEKLKNLEGTYKVEYDSIMDRINKSIARDPTQLYVYVGSVSGPVKAILTDAKHAFSVHYQPGDHRQTDPRDAGGQYKISWED